MLMPLRALFVEDSKDDVMLLLSKIRQDGYEVTWDQVETAEAMEAALSQGGWDIVLSDYVMPSFDGLQAFKVLQKSGIDIPFIIISGTIGEEIAVNAMRMGVHDYLLKGNLTRLSSAIGRELREAKLRKEHKRMEQQLRQAQKLESIGLLAGGVAHDFNNQLSTIMGFADLVLMKIGAEDPMREPLDQIRRASKRAADLTRQLLAFSRKQTLQSKVLDVNRIIVDMEKMLGRLIGRSINLVVNQTEGLWCIKADPNQLEQVIMNLVVNARDAMPEGGKVTLETANVTLDNEDKLQHPDVTLGQHVMIAATDTGVGMDKDTLAKIFEPFFTTKGVGQGTGLGLATVHGIVKQSGGHIWVSSEVGQGTTFRIYFPRTAEVSPDEEPLAPELGEVPRGSETLLLVEDEDGLRKMASECLKDGGYRVFMASDGEKALEVYRNSEAQIHLIIADMTMPNMGGEVFVENALKLKPNVKVLFMSGYAEESVVRRARLSKEQVFLQKPITPGVLLRKVREVLDS